MKTKERIVVAMSGGVDSAVAAALLLQQGYEVIGTTMCFNLPDLTGRRPSCCGISGIEDARRVAGKLGIRHYVLNMQKALEEHVIKDFCAEYLAGRTPNPCIRCNQYIKFDILLKRALSLGARYLATGHYARIIKTQKSKGKRQNYFLKKAQDGSKDQSYFLYRLNQNQLKYILFPLGDYTKSQVRKLAHDFSLPVADKLASQEICFLSENDYRAFLKRRIGVEGIKPGPVVDKDGLTIGRHQGIAFYTVGQRQGLNIALGYPAYILKIEARKSQLVLGRKADAYKKDFIVKDLHFILKPPKKKIAVKVKIRYNHHEALAKIAPCGEKIKVHFKNAQFAITPGQSAVFYQGDFVAGGGIIDEVF